eukprot:4895813-Pyramimonas_sp.AAC.1
MKARLNPSSAVGVGWEEAGGNVAERVLSGEFLINMSTLLSRVQASRALCGVSHFWGRGFAQCFRSIPRSCSLFPWLGIPWRPHGHLGASRWTEGVPDVSRPRVPSQAEMILKTRCEQGAPPPPTYPRGEEEGSPRGVLCHAGPARPDRALPPSGSFCRH